MGVVMKGGTSGNREDALAPVPSSGQAQPVLNTAGSGGMSSDIHFMEDASGNRDRNDLAVMPTGGSIPTGSTDVQEQGQPGSDSNPSDIFRGAPDTGTKGGPA